MFGCCDDKLKAEDVPEEFRELAIVCGYRRPGLSLTESLRSLFALHNETFNIWSHIISFILYIYFFFCQPLDLFRTENHPTLCLLLGCCIFPLCSSLAHLFSSMSPVVRHTCFMIDYLGISIYAFGASVSNIMYALPRSWRGGMFEYYFLQSMFVNCFLCVFISCHTRFMPRNKKRTKVLRLGAFALPYVFGMLPCAYRAMYCDLDDSCVGAEYYAQHFFDTIFTVTFYGGHVPELLFPGYFDIFFQSHTIFHVTVVLGTFHHAQGNMVDAISRPLVDHSSLSCSPLLYLTALVALNSCTIIYFVRKMKARESLTGATAASNGINRKLK